MGSTHDGGGNENDMTAEATTQQTRRVARRAAGADETARARSDGRARVNQLARAWILGALVVGIGVGLFLRFYSTHFEQLATIDAVNAAQVALNVQRGAGLKTSVVYPLHDAIGDPAASRHDINAGPLYPFALGMFFKARGPEDRAVAVFNGILMLLTGAFLYGLLKLTYDKSIAVWAVLAFFISMEAVSQALGAGGATIGGLMVTAALYFGMLAVHNTREREAAAEEAQALPLRIYSSPWLWLALSALSIGLAYLTGKVGWLALGVLVWVGAYAADRRRLKVGIAAAIAVLCVAPWMARNFKHYGMINTPLQQYRLVMETPDFPGRTLAWSMADVPESPVRWAFTHPGAMSRKLAVGAAGLYRQIPSILNPYLFPFLLVGTLLLTMSQQQRRLWIAFWLLAIAQVITIAFLDRDGDAVGIMTPLATGLAVAALITFMRQRLQSRRATVAVGIVAVLLISAPYVASSVFGRRGPTSASKPALDALAAGTPRGAVIATDAPEETAWYVQRRTVMLPANYEQLQKLASAGVEPHMLYLTRALRTPTPPPGREYWARLLMTGQGMDEIQPLIKPQIFPNGEGVVLLQKAEEIMPERARTDQNGSNPADGEG